MSDEPKEEISGVPTTVVAAYLTDLYRQLEAITFNIRTNINNILPKIEGESKDASSNQG
jgi:hypothetical protein